MCGIVGYWNKSNNLNIDLLNENVSNMAKTLHHRGPDDTGVWVDPSSGIALGHRRLSIIDISDLGHQPMFSSNGRFVISYNGEVYNYNQIRYILESKKYIFKSNSDTEVLLASFEEWGIKESLKKFNGMFSFAVWDRSKRELCLARDRIGEKPLYYGVQNNTLFFASELKAIRANSNFKPKIDRNSLALFLKYSYVPAPNSIYEGIKKLLPGNYIFFKEPSTHYNSKSYWSLYDVFNRGIENPIRCSEEVVCDELERRLVKSVQSRMVSDVPLGAFLSGGIDSSTIVALMATNSNHPIKTFTIGFEEKDYNEAVHAKNVAEHLGTDHTEHYVSSSEAREIIHKLPYLYDEPFGDSSQIPTHLISTLAKKNVTVALTGDGGDELFAGYNRYIIAKKFWNYSKYIPDIMKRKAGDFAGRMSTKKVENFYKIIEPIIPTNLKMAMPGEKFQKMTWALKASNKGFDVYNRIVSIIQDPELYLNYNVNKNKLLLSDDYWKDFNDPILSMIYQDLMTYHPDDILQKVDRASMGVSLETRVPFLDHELIEFIMRIPLDLKLKNGEGKSILKKVLYRHVPESLFNRSKRGFTIPLGDWLKDPLKDWAYDLINKKKIKDSGFFDSESVHSLWNEHIEEKGNWSHQLWNILMFQMWYDKNN